MSLQNGGPQVGRRVKAISPKLLQRLGDVVHGGAQYSVQWHFSPTFSNCVSLMTRLLVRSSRPKQQKKRTRPLRLRGVRPSSSPSVVESFDVDDTGLRGIVALAKMSESRLRSRVCGVVCSE